MRAFEPITLTWKGRDYVIPADQVMLAIAKVEDVVTLGRLSRYLQEGDLPLVKIAQAYGTVLRHAGARVDDEEVYMDLFSKGDLRAAVLGTIQALQMMMIPPEHLRAAAKKALAGATSASSRKPTRRR